MARSSRSAYWSRKTSTCPTFRSEVAFAENELVLSSSSIKESVLDEKTGIKRYTSQSWESLRENPSYKDLIEFKDVCLI